MRVIPASKLWQSILLVLRTLQKFVESVFEVGKSGTLQLGTADITDAKTESLGTTIIFPYCKITQTKKQQNNKAYKICTTVRVSGCMCKCAYVSVR